MLAAVLFRTLLRLFAVQEVMGLLALQMGRFLMAISLK